MSFKQDKQNFRFGFSFGLGLFFALIFFVIIMSPFICLLGALIRPLAG